MDSHRLLDSPNQVSTIEPCNVLRSHILTQHNWPFMMYAEKSIGVLINSSKDFKDLSVRIACVSHQPAFGVLVLVVESCLHSNQDQWVLEVV
ncbi:hypothetical protein Tco_0783468 [Tanacetum coccineum]